MGLSLQCARGAFFYIASNKLFAGAHITDSQRDADCFPANAALLCRAALLRVLGVKPRVMMIINFDSKHGGDVTPKIHGSRASTAQSDTNLTLNTQKNASHILGSFFYCCCDGSCTHRLGLIELGGLLGKVRARRANVFCSVCCVLLRGC